LIGVCAEIYATVWDRDYSGAYWTFNEYLSYRHFYGVVATVGTITVGFGLGTQSNIGQWWHDSVAEQVGVYHPALQNAWVLTELAVLPAYRNGGIGEGLHNTLLQDQPLPNALLSTMKGNIAARRFYQRLGWSTLHGGFSFFEGNEPYTILYKRVR
jgi:ribosomal protein S18 acetylase RimI-like enzyme